MDEVVREASLELQRLQRKRTVLIKSRIMQANRLQAIVAGTIGYYSGMKEKERSKLFAEAAQIIKSVVKCAAAHDLEDIIRATQEGIGGFSRLQKAIDSQMLKRVQSLAVAAWAGRPEQRGFGLLMLAVVIGETGDLGNYPNPATVWKRLGCAPYTFDGQTHMGSTWRYGKEGKLTAAEWAAFGYSPRRRSIAYLIGEGIVKQNASGPYRARYDEAKALAKANHPEWTPKRCHLHGMLLATKRLLRELWIEWNHRRGGD